LANSPFRHLPEENVYHELDDASITSIYERINNWSKEGDPSFYYWMARQQHSTALKFIYIENAIVEI
jgi:hypothetical protein